MMPISNAIAAAPAEVAQRVLVQCLARSGRSCRSSAPWRGGAGGSVDRLARPSTPRISQRGPELLARRLPKLALQKLRASSVVRLGQPTPSLRPVELDQAGVRLFVEGRQRDEPAGGLDGRVRVPRGSLEIEQPGKSVRCQLAEPVALGQHPLLEARLSDLQRLEELAAVETVRLFEGGAPAARRALEGVDVELETIPGQAQAVRTRLEHIRGGRAERRPNGA